MQASNKRTGSFWCSNVQAKMSGNALAVKWALKEFIFNFKMPIFRQSNGFQRIEHNMLASFIAAGHRRANLSVMS